MKHKKILSLLVLGLVAAFVLAGCGSSSDDTSSTTTSVSAESETTSTTEQDSDILIGTITAIDDGDITLALYESDTTVTTVTNIDTSSLSASGESETIAIQDDVTVERISDGVTQTASVESLAVGDMIAVSNDSGQLIAILDMDTTSSDTAYSSENTTTSDSDTAATTTSDDSADTSTTTGSSDTTASSSENTVTVD